MELRTLQMRHNKKRNTALLYEFLIRHISKCLIEAKNQEATTAVSMLKKYYQRGPLSDELSLFKSVLTTKVKTPEYAGKVISEAVKQARTLDAKKADRAKGKLINEINKAFDASAFYAHKIPNYVMYASLQNLFNHETGKRKISESIDRLQLQERLASFLTTERDTKQSLREALKLDSQYNNAVYRIVINRFDKKYAGVLNENQKKLLTKYAISLISENKKILTSAVTKEVEGLKERLGFVGDTEVLKDKDLMRKISECRTRLNAIDCNNMSDENMVKVLQFMSLADEVVE